MEFIVAIITLALAVTSTSAVTHIKADCRGVSYAKYVYSGSKDCTGQGIVTAAFKVGVCENTLSSLSAAKSAKFACYDQMVHSNWL